MAGRIQYIWIVLLLGYSLGVVAKDAGNSECERGRQNSKTMNGILNSPFDDKLRPTERNTETLNAKAMNSPFDEDISPPEPRNFEMMDSIPNRIMNSRYEEQLAPPKTSDLDTAKVKIHSKSLSDERLKPPDDYLTRTVDKLMKPLYDATNFFIETGLNPPSLKALNGSILDLAEWQTPGDAMRASWTGFLEHYGTYAACMGGGGAAYVVLALGCGIGTCCCTCRRRSGGTAGTEPKRAKCRRGCCGFGLIFVNLIVLLGIVAAFIANQLIWEQTVTSGMTYTFRQGLQEIQDYQNRTVDEYNKVGAQADEFFASANSQLSSITHETVKDIDERYNVTLILDALQTQSERLPGIIGPIQTTANLTELNGKLETNFQQDLAVIQEELRQNFSSCFEDICDNVTEISNSINIVTNFSLLPDISSTADVFKDLTSGNTTIYVHINESRVSYGTLVNQIEGQIGDEVTRLLTSTTQMDQNLKFLLNYTIDNVILKYDLENAMTDLKYKQVEIANNGDVRYFCCLALCIILLIIVIFGFVAFCFGICGDRAGKDAGFCNRGRGANVLKLTITLIVIFGIIGMGATTFFFILGVITHNDVCHPLTQPQDVPTGTLEALDYALSKKLRLKTSFETFLLHASYNETIYSTAEIAQLGTAYNVSEILNLDNYNITADLATIEAKNYTIAIVILGPDLEQDLTTINDQFVSMELERYQEEVAKAITNLDIQAFAVYLKQLGDDYNAMNDTLSELFYEYATAYEQLHERYVEPMDELSDRIETELEPISDVSNSFNTTRFVSELSEAEAGINSAEIPNDKIPSMARNLTQDYQEFTSDTADQIELQIGPSFAIFEAYEESSAAFCVLFLYPFNAFWLSVGWSLMWFLPLLIIYLCLIDVYDKTKSYEENFLPPRRMSFHRQRPPSSKGKRGKSKHVVAGIELDHDPGCTDDDDDIDFTEYGRQTTSFHGNDAFGYHGRTINDDALEYFGNSNLRVLSRNRGLTDGFLPSTTGTDNSQTSRESLNNQPQPNRQLSTQSVESTQSSGAKSESSDGKSSTKSTLERASRSQTYPVREPPTQVHQAPTKAPQTYANLSSKSPTRNPIPTPFMIAGAANYGFEQGSDENEEYVDEEYVLRMRRTSQRLSRERESKKKRQSAKRADKARVQPWHVEAEERYKRAMSKRETMEPEPQDAQTNSQVSTLDTSTMDATVPKQPLNIYAQNPYYQMNRSARPKYEPPSQEIMIEYPPKYNNPTNTNPETRPKRADTNPEETHNVKPSDVKRRLNQPEPLRVWQPPPPPPLEDDDPMNYPPVSMLASSPARNYSRPSAAVPPYSYAPQRSPPPEPSPAQAFSYLLGQKPIDYDNDYSQAQGQNQGQGQSQGYGQGYSQNQGQSYGQNPSRGGQKDEQPPPYDYKLKYGAGAEFAPKTQNQPVQSPDKPFSYLPSLSGSRNPGQSRSGANQGADYVRQSSAENRGYLNAAYF